MSINIKKDSESLFKGLEKAYGVLYLLLLAFLIFLGARYVSTLDHNSLFYSPGMLAADSNMRAALPVKQGSVTPPIDIVKFSTPDPALVEKGKGLYNTNCASCHGETGAGNGAAGAALNPPPRNFADLNAQTWKNGKKITEMYVTLQEGIAGTGMASFSNIPPEDRFAILQYVQTFNPEYPKVAPDDVAKLDEKYQLSKGVKTPNQIPLDLAMTLRVLDYDTLKADLTSIYNSVSADNTDEGAVKFKSLVNNPVKALNSLASNTDWMESSEAFMKYLSIDPVNKGFKAEAFRSGPETLGRIHQYLVTVFAKNRV
ncbi:MAG: cytochrome c [Ignavibacteria bacterium]|nr:cytochrome c [Ignavibacteria bacterium]